ncbi:MAG: ABC transporter ATP-binding protein [Desulfitobacteriaceae bacterium]
MSLEAKQGQIISIVGESGSGKSTLIRAVLGLLSAGGRVTEGRILFDGKNLLANTERQWQQLRGSKIAMVFQDAGRYLNPIRRIGNQYVESIQSHTSLSKAQCRSMALNMLHKMRLQDGEHILRSYPFELSGGMKQRVAVAMAMTMQPRLLLADEPTSALDVTIQAQVVRQMMELRHEFGTAIVIVTHNMGVASYMADKIGVMQKGILVEWGERDQVINNPRHAYTRQLLSAVPELEGKRLVE